MTQPGGKQQHTRIDDEGKKAKRQQDEGKREKLQDGSDNCVNGRKDQRSEGDFPRVI